MTIIKRQMVSWAVLGVALVVLTACEKGGFF